MSKVKMAEVKIVKLDPAVEKKMMVKLMRAREDVGWFFANEEKLRSKYLNKYIAIKNKKILFTADTPEEMYAKIEASGEDPNDLLCDYMRQEPRCLLY